MLQPLTDNAIRNHLTGRLTGGIYPLIPDETCWFLAVDFDKKSWMADAAAFAATCRRFQVPFAVECWTASSGWLPFRILNSIEPKPCDFQLMESHASYPAVRTFPTTLDSREDVSMRSLMFSNPTESASSCKMNERSAEKFKSHLTRSCGQSKEKLSRK
jgi:hypothetical protein